MVSPELRLPENVSGAFYVTSDCIDCDLCRETAPMVFQRNAEIGLSVVYHQPANTEEHKLAMEGLQGCPAEAIGHAEA